MENKEYLELKGQWRLTARHKETGEETVLWGDNLITTLGKQAVCRFLVKETGYTVGMCYCALGTGTAAVLVTDTKLAYEGTRKAITSLSRNNMTDTFSTFFTAAESSISVAEAGVFSGTQATGGTNSGEIFSHWLVAFNNTAGLYDLTFDQITTVT